MKCDIETLDGHRKKINIEVNPEVVSSAFNKVLRSMQENVDLKGFRKGKVPLDVLKNQFQGDTSKYVIRELIDETLPAALKENSLKPAENPKIEPGTLLEGFPFKYSATFENTPPVNLKNYTGFKTKPETAAATEQEIEDNLKRIHQSLARYEDTLEEVLEGKVCGELELWSADAQEKLETAKGSKLIHEVGQGPLLAKMEEKIVGMKKGETREFSLEVPVNEDGTEKKTFFYKAQLHALKSKTLPELDDEAAKRVGNFASVSELRQKIGEEITRQKDSAQKESIRNQVIEFLLKEHEVEVPEAMKSRWVQTLVYSYATELGKSGLPQDQIEERLKEQSDNFMAAATNQAKASLILGAIGEKEKIQANEEDFRKEILRMSMEQGRNPKEVFEEIESRNLIGAVLEKVEEAKTLDWLLGKALEA